MGLLSWFSNQRLNSYYKQKNEEIVKCVYEISQQVGEGIFWHQQDVKLKEKSAEELLKILTDVHNKHLDNPDVFKTAYSQLNEFEHLLKEIMNKLEHKQSISQEYLNHLNRLGQTITQLILKLEETNKGLSRRDFLIKSSKAAVTIWGAYKLGQLGVNVFDSTTSQVPKSETNIMECPTLYWKIRGMKERKDSFPNMNQYVDPLEVSNFLSRTYHATTGSSLERNETLQNIILTIIYKETGFRTTKHLILGIPIPEVNGGSKGFAQIESSKGEPEVTKEFITLINEIITLYSPGGVIKREGLTYLFGDWNAGLYASYIAGIQTWAGVSPADGDPGPNTLKCVIEKISKLLDEKNKQGFGSNHYDYPNLEKLRFELNQNLASDKSFFVANKKIFLELFMRYCPQAAKPGMVNANVNSLLRMTRHRLSRFSAKVLGLENTETINTPDYIQKSLDIYVRVSQIRKQTPTIQQN